MLDPLPTDVTGCDAKRLEVTRAGQWVGNEICVLRSMLKDKSVIFVGELGNDAIALCLHRLHQSEVGVLDPCPAMKVVTLLRHMASGTIIDAHEQAFDFPGDSAGIRRRQPWRKGPTDFKPGTYDGVLVLQRVEAKPLEEAPKRFIPLPQYVELMNADGIRKALDACAGNRTQAAKLLGVDVRTVFRALTEDE